MRARDVFLALLLIGAGVFLTYEKSGRLDRMFDGWDIRIGFFDEFVVEEQPSIDGLLSTDLRVINGRGGVEIAGAADGQPAVVFRKRIMARNKAEAERIAAGIRMTAEASGGRLVLGTNRESFRRRHFETDFKITISAGTACDIRNSSGRVRIEGAGSTVIENPHGETIVRGISGPLTLSALHGDVDIDSVRGRTRLDASHGGVKVKNVDGALEIDHSNGSVSLEGIGGETVVRARHSGITARALKAGAVIETTYDTIRIADAQGVKIAARHCDITAEDLSGSLDVADTYGLVRIENIRGRLNIDGRNLEVDARGVAAPEILIKTGYRDVRLSGFSGKAAVILNNGRLILDPLPSLSGPVDVQGSYADVRLDWPSSLRAPLFVRTQNGRISWELAGKPDSETTNGVTELRAFTVEMGKPGITIATIHGDVAIGPSGR